MFRSFITAIVLTSLTLATLSLAAGAPQTGWVKKVKAALPDKATATPAQPRKVLVFSACNGFPHSSIPLGAETMRLLGKKTGAYTAVVSDDLANFEPQNINQFDAIIINNATGDFLMPKGFNDKKNPMKGDELKMAREREAVLQVSLVDFVKGGKGIVGIHAATDANKAWKEYGDMIGGYFAGHPWHEKVGIKLDDPASPINAAFGGKGFDIVDEIYVFKEPWSRKNIHGLLSIDISRTKLPTDEMRKKSLNPDNDYAVSWIKTYGQGRVFYCSLGHDDHVFATPAVLKHFLAGIQYAIGDLKADATPDAK